MDLRQYKLSTYGDTKRLLTVDCGGSAVFTSTVIFELTVTDDVLCNHILFKEKLYVYNEEGKRIGRFSITVDTTKVFRSKAIVVHISNRVFIPGNPSETTVTGIVSPNMKTLEEARYEASEVKNEKHERKFYVLRERTKYYCSLTESVCDVSRKRQRTIPFTKTRGVICEAANIILMRSIAVRRFEGILCLKTILSNGKRCRNYYVSKMGKRVVNGVKMDVMIIFRSVTDHKTYSVTSTCVFTEAGQLLHMFWSNSNYFLHIDPDLEVYGKMVDEGKTVGLHRHWNRDKQVFSFYLDKKVEFKNDISSYRISHREIKRVFADWVQYVLVMKPGDILCSALEYFSSFGVNTKQKCSPYESEIPEKIHPI